MKQRLNIFPMDEGPTKLIVGASLFVVAPILFIALAAIVLRASKFTMLALVASTVVVTAVLAAWWWAGLLERVAKSKFRPEPDKGKEPPLKPFQPEWNSDSERDYWQQRAIEYNHGFLEQVRDNADKWRNIFAGLLSLFGVITLVGGPPKLEQLQPLAASVVQFATVVALPAAAAAVFFAGWAASGTPKTVRRRDAEVFRYWEMRYANRMIGRLRTALACGALAMIALLVGTGAVVLGARPPQALVRMNDGLVACGTLQQTPAGHLELQRDGTPPLSLERNVTQIVDVVRCPASVPRR